MSEPKLERITEAELQYFLDGAYGGRVGRALVFEVRRLRRLIADWYATYAHDPEDLMIVGEERALLTEAEAIEAERT